MGLFDSVVKNVALGPIGAMTGGDSPFLGNNNAMDMIPGIGDARAQDKANEANIREAQINRQFQERMSSTAYQRAMDDMQKAGLNPMLAYIQGGASAPSGSQAQVQSSSKTGLADFALKATTGIQQMKQQATALEQQQNMNESTIALNKSTAAQNVAKAEQIRLDNVRKKKYEPLDSMAGAVSHKLEKVLNNLGTQLSSSAKDQQKTLKEIKIIGPAYEHENLQKIWNATRKR